MKISCWQSFQKVSKISPVDAARFVAPKRMNAIFASISLILSCMIFSSVLTFFLRYDITVQVNKHNIYEFKLMNNLYLFGNGSESYEPISSELCEKLKLLPFAKNVEIVYAAHSQPDSYEDGLENSYYLRARVKNMGLLAKDFEYAQEQHLTYEFDTTDNDLRVPVCGVSTATIQKTSENGYFEVLDGTIDCEKFESGDYVIYQPFGRSDNEPVVHAGDTMEIQVYDDVSESYISKNLKVMAVVLNDDPYGCSQFSEIGVCMSDKTFKEIYSDYKQMIVSIAFDSTNPSACKEQQEQIEKLLSRYSGYQIVFSSKYNSTRYFKNERNTSFLIGAFFAIFFGIIGITNTINSIANNVLSNRIAYARMQSVGMTEKQLIKELTRKNLKTYGLGILVFIPLEFFLLTKVYVEFNIEMFAISIIVVLVAVTIIMLSTAYILTKYINRTTIAQRLREIE